MPTWILAVIVASIALTAALTWVLFQINPRQSGPPGQAGKAGDDTGPLRSRSDRDGIDGGSGDGGGDGK